MRLAPSPPGIFRCLGIKGIPGLALVPPIQKVCEPGIGTTLAKIITDLVPIIPERFIDEGKHHGPPKTKLSFVGHAKILVGRFKVVGALVLHVVVAENHLGSPGLDTDIGLIIAAGADNFNGFNQIIQRDCGWFARHSDFFSTFIGYGVMVGVRRHILTGSQRS